MKLDDINATFVEVKKTGAVGEKLANDTLNVKTSGVTNA